jgi:transposase
MYSREDVELALEGLAEGMSVREVSEMVGCRGSTVRDWAAGRLPRSCTGAPPRGRMAPLPGEGGEGAVTDDERAAYEAAMTENQLLRAVLDDLKGEGCAPRSISNRRKAEFGERLRRETGLPLREITAFLRISKSSYEYQRARLGEDRDAALRGPVREAFEEGRGCYGYRRVNALLRLRGTRVSEKRVRRVMREEGLVAARPRRRRCVLSTSFERKSHRFLSSIRSGPAQPF